jgi:hypothetical protein
MSTTLVTSTSPSTDFSVLTESEKALMSSLSRTVTAFRQHLADPELNEWERDLVQAKALAALERLLTPELLRDFMKLQDSPYGFRADSRYPAEVVRRCLIQAWLAGAKVSGNQFNIIAGNCYLTKEFYRAAILDTQGVSNLRLTIGTPQRYGEKAMVCEAKAEWTYCGKPEVLKFLKTEELDARIVVNALAVNGPDAIRGRVESKVYQRVLSVLRGMNDDADEVIEAETIEGSLSPSPLPPADLATNAPEVANPGLPDADIAMEILEAFESDVAGMTSVAAIRKLVHDRECLINSAQWSSSLKEATRHSVQLAAEDRVEEIRASRGEGSNRS